MKALDLTSKKFGKLTVLSRAPNKGGRVFWFIRCSCGTEKSMQVDHIKTAQGCGCIRTEKVRERSFKHGHTLNYGYTRTWKSWVHAKSRCLCPTNHKYPEYGGRGISMCDEWIADFRIFLAEMGERPPKTTLDRLDPNKGYYKENCRWGTPKQQGRTRRSNILVSHNGELLILKDFAHLMQVNYTRLHALVKYKNLTPHDGVKFILKTN